MKKAFTLIELLAVIIVLALIALIATPVVLNIIEQVKIKSAESSAKGYAKAVEYKILNEIDIDGEYDVEENVLEISYQGKGPSTGYFIITKNQVTYGEFCINGYGIKYENSIGKYAPNEVMCSGSAPKHEFIEPEGVACTEIENYDEETNFKIKAVEDLVCISNLSKNGKTFSGKTISLLSDIDINDSNSYNDINNTTYGDINGNGTVEGIQVELTTGQGFLPIGSSSVPFSGTFEGYGFTLSNLMINRNVDNVGLFGYVNGGVIKGINISNISVNGKQSVGGIVGYLNSGTINEINLSGNVIGSGNYVGGAIGYSNIAGNKMKNLLLNMNVTGNNYVGGLLGFDKDGTNSTLTGVLESGTLTGGSSVGKAYSYCKYHKISINVYASSQTSGGGKGYYYNDGTYYVSNNEMLNGYDEVLDTWIGGDNDSSGYYFDYDSNNKIVVKSVEREPITFTLKGKGTEENPYLINNYQQWKEATTKAGQNVYFKLNNDIDFNSKVYYSLGTTGNKFNGTLDGDNNTLSNINIKGANNTGLIGYNNGGVIKGLNINTLTVSSGTNNVGGIVGYNSSGSVYGINMNNVTVKGYDSVGGTIGNLNTGVVKEIALSGNVEGNSKIGGIVGYSNTAGVKMTSLLVNANVKGNSYIGGLLGFDNNGDTSTLTGVLETGSVSGGSSVAKAYGYCKFNKISTNVYASSQTTSQLSGSYYNDGVYYALNDEMINVYDEVLDTWIGGDNDSSGYYFDYDSNNKIVVKSIKKEPITFTLLGSGTSDSPYLINNYQEWKEATTKLKGDNYFKVVKDIDFNNKPYYAMGTNGNYFVGTLDGDNNTLSNITINGANNAGLIGYNNGGVIKGLNVNTLTVSSANNNVGGIVGYNSSGTIVGMNIDNVTVNGIESVGGVVGYLNTGLVKEITLSGNVNGNKYTGGIVGYSNIAGNQMTSLLVNANVKGNSYIGGLLGFDNNGDTSTLTGVLETGSVSGGGSVAKAYGYCKYNKINTNVYASSQSTSQLEGYYKHDGTYYTLELPITVTYTENNNRIEIDSLSYYNSVGTLDTRIGGDNDNSGYYFDYNSSGNKIIVVPSGAGVIKPGGNVGTTGSIEIDSNYTMTQINGTTDTTAPTCELYYVRAVSNGIQASFSCTDDNGVPTLRSLFDSTTSKSAETFDNIGTLKNGTVTGNTKTVVSTWNTNNTVSKPTKGTCYYFRYGAQDAEGNFSTYVTNVCYTGFSE